MDSALIATTLTLTSTSTGLFPTGYFHLIEQLLLHVLCVSYLSSPRPSSAVRLFYFPDGRYFAKIMCIRCYNNETVTRRPLSSVQPLSTIVEAHVNIHNFSMIRSMFRPLLRWLLLLNIAFNEYDFLEKHGHLLLLPFDYWLIEKMRARSFSFSFQFKHWISQTVIQVLFALPIESTGASIFQHSIEMHQQRWTNQNWIRKNWHRNGKCNRLRNK